MGGVRVEMACGSGRVIVLLRLDIECHPKQTCGEEEGARACISALLLSLLEKKGEMRSQKQAINLLATTM
jgi:hypothetical protein